MDPGPICWQATADRSAPRCENPARREGDSNRAIGQCPTDPSRQDRRVAGLCPRADRTAQRTVRGVAPTSRVRERTFRQSTPIGDFVIVTLEGDDPIGAFRRMMERDDDFTRWFLDQIQSVHGVDVTQPLPGPPPELVADSGNDVVRRETS